MNLKRYSLLKVLRRRTVVDLNYENKELEAYLDTLVPDESAYEYDGITDYRWELDKKSENK